VIHLVEEWDSGAEQHGMNIEPNFVNQVCLEERLRQQTAAHNADVFAFLLF
jgi:hypothetical protein